MVQRTKSTSQTTTGPVIIKSANSTRKEIEKRLTYLENQAWSPQNQKEIDRLKILLKRMEHEEQNAGRDIAKNSNVNITFPKSSTSKRFFSQFDRKG